MIRAMSRITINLLNYMDINWIEHSQNFDCWCWLQGICSLTFTCTRTDTDRNIYIHVSMFSYLSCKLKTSWDNLCKCPEYTRLNHFLAWQCHGCVYNEVLVTQTRIWHFSRTRPFQMLLGFSQPNFTEFVDSHFTEFISNHFAEFIRSFAE